MGLSTHTLMLEGEKPRLQTQGGVQVTGGVACLTGLSQSELHTHRPEGEVPAAETGMPHTSVCVLVHLSPTFLLS